MRLSIFRCFFLRIRFRRFFIREPMAAVTVALPEDEPAPRGNRTTVRCCRVAGSSTGRTPDFGSGGCRFETCPASKSSLFSRYFL